MTAFATQKNIQTTGTSVVPIGANGSGRSKLLTAAELRAAAEAYSSAQVDTLLTAKLNLSGGTLTGPITGTGGLIQQRDGLNAQCLDIFETFTSGTNNGKLRFKATSTGHQIGSARATSGSNRSLLLGHFDASEVFTAAVTITTAGRVDITNALQVVSNTSLTWQSGGTGVRQLEINSGIGTVLRWNTTQLLLNSAGIEMNSRVILVPPSSVTLATNGQFSIEMTSNTAGNLVYRGSDGTTRRMALTFV